MGVMVQLGRFNFWSRKIYYNTLYSVQGILGLNRKLSESPHLTGCNSDQEGSQEDGGMDCNSEGTG